MARPVWLVSAATGREDPTDQKPLPEEKVAKCRNPYSQPQQKPENDPLRRCQLVPDVAVRSGRGSHGSWLRTDPWADVGRGSDGRHVSASASVIHRYSVPV